MTEYDPGNPGNLSTLLWAVVNGYWTDYERYWGLLEGGRAGEPMPPDEYLVFFRLLRDIGDAIPRAILHLTLHPGAEEAVRGLLHAQGAEGPVSAATVARILRDQYSSPIVRDHVSISLALEAADILIPAADRRAPELVKLIASRKLSPIAEAYLGRATQAYLWGFDAECVVMCRSVLEAALVSVLTDTLRADEPPPSLDRMLALAGQHGFLSGYLRTATRRGWRANKSSVLADADAVRRAGNEVVHHHPQTRSEASDDGSSISVLTKLARVLDALFPVDEGS